jgi:hypothetical protein
MTNSSTAALLPENIGGPVQPIDLGRVDLATVEQYQAVRERTGQSFLGMGVLEFTSGRAAR